MPSVCCGASQQRPVLSLAQRLCWPLKTATGVCLAFAPMLTQELPLAGPKLAESLPLCLRQHATPSGKTTINNTGDRKL